MIRSLFLVPMYKLRTSWGIWRSVALVIGLAFLIAVMASNFELGGLSGQRGYLEYPYIWVNSCWMMRHLNYLLAFLLISFIRRDADQLLLRQSIISGWSPCQLVTSYSMVAVLFATISAMTVAAVGLYIGKVGSSGYFDLASAKVFLSFFLTSFALFHLAIAVALLASSPINAAIGLMMLNSLGESIVERLLSWMDIEWASSYLPFASMAKLVPSPIFPPFGSTTIEIELKYVAIVSTYALIFWLLSWCKIRFSDL